MFIPFSLSSCSFHDVSTVSFTYYNPYNPIRWVVVFAPFYRREHWGMGRLNNLPKFPRLLYGGMCIRSQPVSLAEPKSSSKHSNTTAARVAADTWCKYHKLSTQGFPFSESWNPLKRSDESKGPSPRKSTYEHKYNFAQNRKRLLKLWVNEWASKKAQAQFT